MASRAQLVGTRLAFVGTLLYLIEWLVIPFMPDLPTASSATTPVRSQLPTPGTARSSLSSPGT